VSLIEPTAAEVTEASSAEAKAWEEIREREPRNLLALSAHYIVLRIAWVFKTESVIMPAFLDTIAGAGWVRGCLPILNRFGQSVPPIMLASRLSSYPQKKWAVLATTLMMAVPFLILSTIWMTVEQGRQTWLPAVFLGLYVLFFAATGLNQLAFGTLQGKLIRADRRGRLLSIAGIVGSVVSIICVWFVMRRWLELPDHGFGYIFAFTGIGLVASALVCLCVSEPSVHRANGGGKSGRPFADAWSLFRSDRHFRRFAVVAMLFVTSQTLFPHYQALGRNRPQQWDDLDLMMWVIAQNAAVGVFALLSGSLADATGNRLALRLQVFCVALTPLSALILVGERFQTGPDLFWLTFCLLGMTPVTFRTLTNYALELSHHDDHPRYISTLKLFMAIPFLFSPLIGLLVDVVGFATVFLTVSALVMLGGILTFRMIEPRYDLE